MTRLEEYRFDFEVICKEVLADGAVERKIVKNKTKLDKLAKKVEWFYGFVEDSEIDDKNRLLYDINRLLGNIRYMISDIDRFVDTSSFTDYFDIVKMCVNVIIG